MELLITALIGLLIGSLIGWLFGKMTTNKAASSLQHQHVQELQSKEIALTQAQTKLNEVQKQHETLLTESKELQSTLAQTQQKQSGLEADVKNLNQQLKEQKESFDKEWSEKFETLSNRTLNRVTETLEDKAKKEYQERQELLNKDIKTLLEPIEKLVKDNEVHVKELSDKTLTETTSLKKHLELSFQQTKELIDAKNKIVSVLTDNKGRGDWGELQLLRLLNLSGLVKDRDYHFQHTQAGDTRPDVRINLPNGHTLYIDAKTLVGKLDHLNQELDEARSNEERKTLCSSLRKEILKLNVKDYQSKESECVDFVILYVPRESMLRIPLEEYPMLLDEAFERNVILSSPLILMGILKTVAQGWANSKVTDHADEIIKMGKELHKRAATFLEKFEGMGKTLTTLTAKYDDAKTSFLGQQGFIPQINKLEEVGAKSTKLLPESYRTTELLESVKIETTIELN